MTNQSIMGTVSENVRMNLSATEPPKAPIDMLDEIMAYYRPLYGDGHVALNRKELCTRVANELWQQGGGSRCWTWRYVQSVSAGTLEPSRFMVDAIAKTWHLIQGEPAYIQTPACPTCGGACTFDCGTQRPVDKDAAVYDPAKQKPIAKPGTGRKREKRPAVNIRSAPSTLASLVNAGASGAYLSELARLILDAGIEVDY